MAIHYYLSVFPTEAVIASMLEPKNFGAYMATGSKRSAAEQIIFFEITGEEGEGFDWEYAKKECVPHENGDPKHSVYLAVYRALEKIPVSALGNMYLTTKDGRSLELEGSDYVKNENTRGYFIYQELAPTHPLVVSSLDPISFVAEITNPAHKVYVPKLVFADMKTLNFDDLEHTGNLGSLYDGKVSHLMDCISSVTGSQEKPTKTLSRSHVESFSFQGIDKGIYVSDGTDTKAYYTPTLDELKQIDYDWGRSAMIL